MNNGGAKSFLKRLHDELCKDDASILNYIFNVTSVSANKDVRVVRVDGFYNTKNYKLIDYLINYRLIRNIEKANGIIYQSEWSKLLLKKINYDFEKKIDKFSVIPNGVHINLNVKHISHVLYFCANVGFMHNPNFVIDLVERILKKTKIVNVVFIISPRTTPYELIFQFYKKQRKNISKLYAKYPKQVAIYENLNTSEVQNIMVDKPGILLYPSYFAGDACPNMILEASSYGCLPLTPFNGPPSDLVIPDLKVEGKIPNESILELDLSCSYKYLDFLQWEEAIEQTFQNAKDFQLQTIDHLNNNHNISKIASKYKDFVMYVRNKYKK